LKKDQDQLYSEIARIEKWYQIQESIAIHFSKLHSKNIEKQDVFNALFLLLESKYDLEWPGDLWDVEMEFNEVLNLLQDYDFDFVLHEIETPKDIFPDDLLAQYKVKIKANGLIWFIHNYDPDPFPSSPHAHQIENNIKLDLSNGKCYKKREYVYSIARKDLVSFRKRASAIYKGKLPHLEI
jgi:hypothetical protein